MKARNNLSELKAFITALHGAFLPGDSSKQQVQSQGMVIRTQAQAKHLDMQNDWPKMQQIQNGW